MQKNIIVDITNKLDKNIETQNEKSFIELKYKTKTRKITRHKKQFTLKTHTAQDIGRKHFVLDIKRLEELSQKYSTKNYCIMLTNDSSHWMPKKYK